MVLLPIVSSIGAYDFLVELSGVKLYNGYRSYFVSIDKVRQSDLDGVRWKLYDAKSVNLMLGRYGLRIVDYDDVMLLRGRLRSPDIKDIWSAYIGIVYNDLYRLVDLPYVDILTDMESRGVMQGGGIVYSHYRQNGTKTGRTTTSGINIQCVSDKSTFRSRDGYKFIIADYSQIEMRILAYLSRNEELLGIFRRGGDVHSEVADILGVDRQVGKVLNFAMVYGMSIQNICKRFGVSRLFVDEYYRRFGRNRIENKHVQGLVAKIMKLVLVRLYRLGRGHILTEVHDEVLLEVLDRDVCIVDEVRRIMEGVGGIELRVNIKVSNNWIK